MNFKKLITIIEQTSNLCRKKALSSVEQFLVIRNWIIGAYIVEYEQKGTDRAKYGEKLFENLAKEFKQKKIGGLSKRNLHLFVQFYNNYPQFVQTLSAQLQCQNKNLDNLDNISIKKVQTLSAQLNKNNIQLNAAKSEISILRTLSEELPESTKLLFIQKKEQTVSEKSELYIEPDILLTQLSFSHFTELIKIDDDLKRVFYEIETIKGQWSVRELKRQIGSLMYERTGLSKNKKKLIDSVHKKAEQLTIEDTIKDPYILEFTGFKELPVYSESDLETELLNKIQYFLLELGHGFCFEARQKRITIGSEHDRIDLVFYHRILKCHVLVDLKTRPFSHGDIGQMNFYLNYYKKNMMHKGDNPPVGIILCSVKDDIKVEYASAGLSNKMFVSKYMVELPEKKELENLLKH